MVAFSFQLKVKTKQKDKTAEVLNWSYATSYNYKPESIFLHPVFVESDC